MTMYDLKVFLVEDAKISLEDEFIDKEDDLRHFIYSTIKSLAKSATLIIMNGQFVANILNANGEKSTKTIKLKEFNLDKFAVKSDSSWLPENIDADEAHPYKIRVGQKTFSMLEDYFKIFQARVSIFNKTVDRNKKGFDEDNDLAVPVKCWEQIIHEALITPVMQKIDASLDKDLENDFKEVYEGKKDKAKKKKEKRNKTK